VASFEETALTPRTLLLLAVFTAALAACTSPPAPAPEFGAASTARSVVVAPLNVAVRAPADLASKGDPVWTELLSYFQRQDRQVAVLSPLSAERLWLAATSDLDLSDRQAALRTAYSRFARELAGHRDFDLLVVPSLVVRPAQVSGLHASWDGVQRPVPNAATAVQRGVGDLTGPGADLLTGGLTGKVAAASLHVVVLRADGTRLYDGLGGLDVLQEARRDNSPDGALRFAARRQPFPNREWVAEGVERAFEGPVLTAR
jgi:hypothetical protein